jgi:hypothetical protein
MRTISQVSRALGTRNATSLSALALLAVGGCATTAGIAPDQLGRLDGYDAQRTETAARTVHTLDGRSLTFDPKSTLRLDLWNQRPAGRYTAIRVQGDVFVGTTTDGREVQVPLSQIEAATVEKPASLAAELLVVGGVVIGAGLLALLALGIYGSTTHTVAGRALRLRRRAVVAPLGSAPEWAGDEQPAVSELSGPGRDALATYWRDAALGEHASIPAFSRLSMTLMALGAPSRLVDAAHRAAREEVEHARIAFAMASAYAGRRVAPGPLTALASAPAITATSLPALAAESVIDGCLLEGFAAATLAAGRARASDPAVRDALATLGRDETSHAQLAWDIVAWCIDNDGPDLAWSLVALVDRAQVPAAKAFDAALAVELARHGWLDPDEWRRLFIETRASVLERLQQVAGARLAA